MVKNVSEKCTYFYCNNFVLYIDENSKTPFIFTLPEITEDEKKFAKEIEAIIV